MVEALRAGKVAVFVSPERAERDARAAAARGCRISSSASSAQRCRTAARVVVGPVTRTLGDLAKRRDYAQLMVADPASSPWRSWLRHAALRSAQPAITFVP